MIITEKHRTVLTIIVLFLIFIIAISYLLYDQYQRVNSPEYSLLRMRQSIERRDISEFEKYVSIYNLAEQFTDHYIKKKLEEQKMPENELEDLARSFSRGMIYLQKPTLISESEKGLRKQLRSGGFDFLLLLDSIACKRIEKEVDLQESYLQSKRVYKRVVFVRLVSTNENAKKLVSNIKMQEVDGYWQIVESDLVDFLSKLSESRK